MHEQTKRLSKQNRKRSNKIKCIENLAYNKRWNLTSLQQDEIFNKRCWDNWVAIWKKLYVTSYMRINSKCWIKDLNITYMKLHNCCKKT